MSFRLRSTDDSANLEGGGGGREVGREKTSFESLWSVPESVTLKSLRV